MSSKDDLQDCPHKNHGVTYGGEQDYQWVCVPCLTARVEKAATERIAAITPPLRITHDDFDDDTWREGFEAGVAAAINAIELQGELPRKGTDNA